MYSFWMRKVVIWWLLFDDFLVMTWEQEVESQRKKKPQIPCLGWHLKKKYVKWWFFNTIYGFELFTNFRAKSGNFSHAWRAQVKTKRPSVPCAWLLSKNSREKVATLLLILHRVKFSSNNLRIVSLLMWPLHFPQERQAPSNAPPPCP